MQFFKVITESDILLFCSSIIQQNRKEDEDLARIRQLKKDQLQVRKLLRQRNKALKEDCFAGRFEYRQVGRKDFNDDGWYSSIYKIEFRDNEDPSRNKVGCFDKYEIRRGWDFFNMMNDLIIESDFWDKWRSDQEYRNAHWYTGDQLKEMEAHGGIEKDMEKWKAKASFNKWQYRHLSALYRWMGAFFYNLTMPDQCPAVIGIQVYKYCRKEEEKKIIHLKRRHINDT